MHLGVFAPIQTLFSMRTERARSIRVPRRIGSPSRAGLNPILAKLNLKQDGKALHSFRRFRIMHLRKSRVPWDLEKFWVGHANRDVTEKYAAQLEEDMEWRKDVAEKAGQGLALPESSEISIGQLGQPEMTGSEEAKAA